MDAFIVVNVLLILLITSLSVFLYLLFTDPHLVMDAIKGRERFDIYAAEHDHSNTDFTTFLIACSTGRIEKAEAILKFHPSYLNRHSDESGETCLHVAAIFGKSDLTRAMLAAGANPNVRSKFEHGGHRMTPLAWNVYHGHYDTAKVLVEHSFTDINMDVDSMYHPGRKVTPLDMIYDVLPSGHMDEDHVMPDDHAMGMARLERFYKLKELFLDHGAKTYTEVIRSSYHRDDEL